MGQSSCAFSSMGQGPRGSPNLLVNVIFVGLSGFWEPETSAVVDVHGL